MLCKRFGCHAQVFVSMSQGVWKAGALHAHDFVSMSQGVWKDGARHAQVFVSMSQGVWKEGTPWSAHGEWSPRDEKGVYNWPGRENL